MSENIKTEIPNYRFDKDEFDLKEYAKIIIKRRKAIYNIILLCVLISAIFGLLLSKTYDIYAIVRLGSISSPLIPKKEVLYEIRNREIPDTVAKTLNLNADTYDFNSMISVEEINDSDLIKIKARYPDPVLSMKICNAIADIFVEQENKVYDKLMALLEEQIITVRISKSLDSSEKHFLLQKQLMTAKDFAVIERSYIPRFSFWLGLGYKIAVAATSGLMLGLLVIFMQEFLGRGQRN